MSALVGLHAKKDGQVVCLECDFFLFDVDCLERKEFVHL